MPDDIRVKISFFSHYKTKLLHKKYGDSGITSLWKLWAYAAVHQQDGDLSRWDEYRMQLACERDADCMEFVEFLASKQVHFLDKREKNGKTTLKINDWAEHQPWVYNSKKRSKVARENASKRWNNQTKDNNANGMPSAQGLHNVGNAPSPFPSSPSPTPKRGTRSTQIDKIAFEKAEAAWTKLDEILRQPPEVRFVISDTLSKRIVIDLGGREKVLDLHGQNGDRLKNEFINRYSILEVASFKEKTTNGSGNGKSVDALLGRALKTFT